MLSLAVKRRSCNDQLAQSSASDRREETRGVDILRPESPVGRRRCWGYHYWIRRRIIDQTHRALFLATRGDQKENQAAMVPLPFHSVSFSKCRPRGYSVRSNKRFPRLQESRLRTRG